MIEIAWWGLLAFFAAAFLMGIIFYSWWEQRKGKYYFATEEPNKPYRLVFIKNKDGSTIEISSEKAARSLAEEYIKQSSTAKFVFILKRCLSVQGNKKGVTTF